MKYKCFIFVIAFVFVVLTLYSCAVFEDYWKAREKEYYAMEENYVVLTATVTAPPRYFNEDDYYILYVEFDDNEAAQFEKRVEIHKANGDILEQNGYFDEISLGDEIQITLAPEIFGDGYVIPAVGIKNEGKVYLDFETGKANLMARYD